MKLCYSIGDCVYTGAVHERLNGAKQTPVVQQRRSGNRNDSDAAIGCLRADHQMNSFGQQDLISIAPAWTLIPGLSRLELDEIPSSRCTPASTSANFR